MLIFQKPVELGFSKFSLRPANTRRLKLATNDVRIAARWPASSLPR